MCTGCLVGDLPGLHNCRNLVNTTLRLSSAEMPRDLKAKEPKMASWFTRQTLTLSQ